MSYEPASEPADKSDVLDKWVDGLDKYRIVTVRCGRDVRVDAFLDDGWFVLPQSRVVEVLVERVRMLRVAGKNLVGALEVFK